MSALSAILREQITRQGPMSCEDFMRRALYCPELGYYEGGHAPPGRAGDFATSVSIGPAFGRLLALQFLNWLDLDAGDDAGAPQMLVECGAHDGRLAADILSAVDEIAPAAAPKIEYWILEPSTRRLGWQRERLAPFAGRVRWAESFAALPRPVTGIIFSNELLDAMPVRRLGWDRRAARWFEWGVGLRGAEFTWQRLEGSAFSSASVYSSLGLEMSGAERTALEELLPDGFTVELHDEAVRWWGEAARALSSGALVTFDYGGTIESLFRPERTGGTLRAYKSHRVSDRVLENPGEQDLTAHVNFTAIRRAGEAEGLHTAFLGSQERFLSAVLKEATLPDGTAWNWTGAAGRQLASLLHAEHLGRAMCALVQKRGRR